MPELKQVQRMNFYALSSEENEKGVLVEMELKPEALTERYALTLEQAQEAADGLLLMISRQR